MTNGLDDPSFDAATCSECGIVLRETPNSLRCPACGWTVHYPDVDMPPEFEGPSIHSG